MRTPPGCSFSQTHQLVRSNLEGVPFRCWITICTPTVFVKTEGVGVRRSFGASCARLRRAERRAQGRSQRERVTGLATSLRSHRSSSVGLGAPDLTGAAFSGHNLRRGAMWSGVAARVHIACLKQFSGHASLKRLEEYAKLEKLRQNRLLRDVPLTRARRSSAPACPAPLLAGGEG
jgi:hypothetical protein